MAAAQRILRGEGYPRLTMERVASESGVAKTTIYRRWPTKAALCMELYLDAALEVTDPQTGNVADDLKRIAETVVRIQTRTVAGQALIGLIAEAQINPDTGRDFLAQFANQRRTITKHVLERAIKRGELQADANIDLIIDAVGGAITFRLLQGHAPVNREFTGRLIDLILHGCSSAPARGKKES